MPGTSTSSLPAASSFIVTVMRRSGRVMRCATKIDTASVNNSTSPAIASDRCVDTQVCALRSSI